MGRGIPRRQRISRTNDHAQAGERYRSIEPWERDDLVLNLVDALSQCDLVEHLTPVATPTTVAA